MKAVVLSETKHRFSEATLHDDGVLVLVIDGDKVGLDPLEVAKLRELLCEDLEKEHKELQKRYHRAVSHIEGITAKGFWSGFVAMLPFNGSFFTHDPTEPFAYPRAVWRSLRESFDG